MVRPGEIAPWNRSPLVWPGVTGPLLQCPPAEIETPEIQRLGVGHLVTFRRWGFPVGELPDKLAQLPPSDWPDPPPWGLGNSSDTLISYVKHSQPAGSPEVLRPFDVLRCVEPSRAAIQPTGVAYELAHVEVPTAAVLVLERCPTILEVTALDEAQVPIYTYGNLGGTRPCVAELAHPDPEVTQPLTWEFRVTVSHVPDRDRVQAAPLAYLGPAAPTAIAGRDLLPPWNDLRRGTRDRWGDELQIPVEPRRLVRLWVTLRAPANRFDLKVGGRLAGYWQSCGVLGRALDAATTRSG